MPSFVVTGASRGLGYEFIRQFSTIPDATVFGLVRNVSATEQKVNRDGLKNIHLIQADITNRASLQAAATQIANTVDSVDYLINNAAYISGVSAFEPLSGFLDKPEILESELLESFRTNVIGVVETINIFLPLIHKSSIKKVITIGSGMADDELANGYEVFESAPYSISKAAVNTVMAKFNARHGKTDGILFLSLSPGMVDTSEGDQPQFDNSLPAKMMKAYPDWKGPITAEESVTAMRAIIEKATPTNEFAGAFVSHYGNKTWL